MTTSVTRLFHNTTRDLRDQDQDRFFWSQTGLVLRSTVSDHITAAHGQTHRPKNITFLRK